MTKCKNCGSHVSSTFARVMGDNNRDVHHCFDCTDGRELIRKGASAYEDIDKAIRNNKL